jgi:DNA-directed RNA polymerase subunit RPC12/RpoP
MSRDYLITGNPADGVAIVHRLGCTEGEAARLKGWPILQMLDCKKDIHEIVAEYHRDRPDGEPPVLHTCLDEEEPMNTTEAVLCPRCESRMYRPYGRGGAPQGGGVGSFAMPPALSRMDNQTYICSECGQDEAMRDFQGLAPIPPSEWPIDPHPPEFGIGSHTPKPLDE